MTLLTINTTDLVAYGILAILALIVYFVTIRYVFSINHRNRMLEAQVRLLAEMALKQGVSKETVTDITDQAFP